MQEIHAHHETHAILDPLTLLLYKPVSHPPVSFLEDENCLMAFNQFGAGSNIWKSDKHQTHPEMTTRKVLKFNSADIDYYLSLKPQSNGVPHMDQLCEIFHSMVCEMTTGMAQWPRPLWSDISLPFTPYPELNAARIMGDVHRVLQSNENVNLQDRIHIHLVHVDMPRGGVVPRKRKYYVFKLSKFLDTKKCVLRIQNKDLLCLARALVKHGSPRKATWLKLYSSGMCVAKNLGQGVTSEGWCSRGSLWPSRGHEVPASHRRLLVHGRFAEHFNTIVFEGPKREKHIHLTVPLR